MTSIYLIKDHENVPFSYEACFEYVRNLGSDISFNGYDVTAVAKRVYNSLKAYNTADDIDDAIIRISSNMIIKHPDYQKLGVKIKIARIHKATHSDYSKVLNQLMGNISANGKPAPIVDDEYATFVMNNIAAINAALDYSRDYNFTLFGLATLENTYLKKDKNKKLIERPQHLFMRVALGVHYKTNNIDRVLETYFFSSAGYMTHATPTLFNAGTKYPQLSSCFLVSLEDTMKSIGKCWADCAEISKHSGGISVYLGNLRHNGSYIRSTQGYSNGLYVMKVFNEVSRYSNQGGKRPGSIAIYIDVFHPDIYFFLDSRKGTGAETERCRDLFISLMVYDLFMKRVESGGMWSLMCPDTCPDIMNKYGEEFEEAYLRYEQQGMYVKQVKAQDLFVKILDTIIETNNPNILHKESINEKSNQKNIGVINSSNLCTEIMQVSTADEYAVCNLASICLSKYVKEDRSFDYDLLCETARILTRNLNAIIDINYYPVPETRVSNMKNRPIGIGVQGLADVFAMMKTPFDSPLARDVNKKIFETIYFGAMTESVALAKEFGCYPNYQGSPASEGIYQYNMWGLKDEDLSGMWDWQALREEQAKYGLANSLLTTCMPTASTSQIMGNNETIEAYDNMYTRKTGSGNFFVVNRHMVEDLTRLGLWNSDTVEKLRLYEGSLAKISGIPDDIKAIYRTIWEIPNRHIIDMAADRGPFIDQSQSMNLYMSNANRDQLASCFFQAWRLRLKTWLYYLRTRANTSATKFGISTELIESMNNESIESEEEVQVCRLEEGCIFCSG